MRRTKKLLTTIFMICLVIAGAISISQTAKAAESDFVIENGVLTKYNGSGGAVVIPKGVTHIGKNVFWGCTRLTSVSIPNSVTVIDSFAFADCSKLKSISIPKNVTKIGVKAFSGCTSLSTLTVYNKKLKVYNFGDGALENIFYPIIDGESWHLQYQPLTIKGYNGSTAQQMAKILATSDNYTHSVVRFVDLKSNKSTSYGAKVTSKVSIKKGKSKKIKITLPKTMKKVSVYSEPYQKNEFIFKYKSKNKRIASVNKQGKITGKKKGSTQILVTAKSKFDNEKTYIVKVTVK